MLPSLQLLQHAIKDQHFARLGDNPLVQTELPCLGVEWVLQQEGVGAALAQLHHHIAQLNGQL